MHSKSLVLLGILIASTASLGGELSAVSSEIPDLQIAEPSLSVSSSVARTDVSSAPFKLMDNNPVTLRISDLVVGIVPICVLASDPSKKEEGKFADCMMEKSCENWKKYQDGDGTTAMICQD